MGNLADIAAHENKWRDALAMLRGVAGQTANATERGRRLRDVGSGLVRAIWNFSGGHPDDSLKNEAFVAAQRLHETQAGAALTLMSARFAAGNDAVASVVRRQQDLKATLESLDKRITSELGAPDGKRNDALLASLRSESWRAPKSLAETPAQILRDFPGYAELSNPAPLGLPQTQALLKPDEALVEFLAISDCAYVFAVTRESSAMPEIPLPATHLPAPLPNPRKDPFRAG